MPFLTSFFCVTFSCNHTHSLPAPVIIELVSVSIIFRLFFRVLRSVLSFSVASSSIFFFYEMPFTGKNQKRADIFCNVRPFCCLLCFSENKRFSFVLMSLRKPAAREAALPSPRSLFQVLVQQYSVRCPPGFPSPGYTRSGGSLSFA